MCFVLSFGAPIESANRMEPTHRTIKIKLTIAYHGAHYNGWQTQKTGTGVQSLVEACLKRLFPTAGPLCGSSRTDTGVHALGMVAHVSLPTQARAMQPRKLRLAMNALLPSDIRVISAARVPLKFHARYDAKRKQYHYLIWNHPAMNPLLVPLAWHVPVALDLKAMQQASSHFLGTRDFKSVASNRNYAYESTTRTLTRCDVRRKGAALKVVIEGDGFLYKMCRGIVGTLVTVGKGKWEPETIPSLLLERNRCLTGMNAPAHGLSLHKVFY
jgi:tRNA pseudouridine38-40 synthase